MAKRSVRLMRLDPDDVDCVERLAAAIAFAAMAQKPAMSLGWNDLDERRWRARRVLETLQRLVP